MTIRFEPEPDNLFWRFSLALYDWPEVGAACLELQDRWDADVNLVLYCAWVGANGHCLTPTDIDVCLAATTAWRGDVVQPIRALRRGLKAQIGKLDARIADVRAKVAAAEMHAEQIQQAILYDLRPERGAGLTCGDAALIGANIAALLARIGASAPPEAYKAIVDHAGRAAK